LAILKVEMLNGMVFGVTTVEMVEFITGMDFNGLPGRKIVG